MASEMEAIEALTELGLTEYEARCYVALSQLSQGTANDISRVADVPQSRVYDVADDLHHRGLVDIEGSNPKRYFALPADHAIERLHREFSDRMETASAALDALGSRDEDGDGAWTIASREDVSTRVGMHTDGADEEIYLHLAREEFLEPSTIDALAGAGERDVPIYVEVPAEELREEIHGQLPRAQVAVSELTLDSFGDAARGPGRLLMVDRETLLLSAQQDGLVPGEVDETGLWGSEVAHGLVAWLRPLLVARMEQVEFTVAS